MEPIVVVAIISGIGGLAASTVTLYTAYVSRQTQNKQIESTEKIDAMQLRLDGWTDLVGSLREELDREQAKNAALLRELDECRKAKGTP